MFHLHTAFAVQLLALIAAGALLAWTGYVNIHAKNLVRVVAYSAIVLSVLGILCAGYYGLKYSQAGYFESPAAMMRDKHAGMMKCDKMKDGTGADKNMMEEADKMEAASGDNGSSEATHSHDH
jgi:hypothetical protein